MFIRELIKNLNFLTDFLRLEKEGRETSPLLRTSPYYRRLAYALIRRELFETIKTFGASSDLVFKELIKTWKDLKEWGLDGRIREGIMHECLYWLSSLRWQAESSFPVLVAPIHEAIPPQEAASVPEDEKLHFRGDFIALWSDDGHGRSAIVDVKADFGIALDDDLLRETAKRYESMGLLFYFASPAHPISNFDEMVSRKHLLDLRTEWEHRPYPFGFTGGPYPRPVQPPWIE